MADPTPTEQPKRRSMPLWLRILFVVSLAGNLLVVGLIVGVASSPKGPRGSERIAGDVGAAPFVRALEGEDRRALARDIMRENGGFRQMRQETRARAEELFAALRAEQFDREAVEMLLQGQREQAARRQLAGESALLNRLEAMTLEERVAYADRLAKALRRGPKRDGQSKD